MCEHSDYNDYFEKCMDCGKTGLEIHEAECVPAGFETDEDGHCERCGTILEEAA